ncbi:hypothetical protein MMA231_02654 [Asticcacaulis sp. MM231]|uniref:hypothetical protein n=1 Tax=Asticcacaulis sp. MM231 TaxID=3157666 RepID=UPI0032D58397
MLKSFVTGLLVLFAIPAMAADLPQLKLNPDTGRMYSDASPEVRLFGVNYLGGSYQYFAVYKGKGGDIQPLKRPLFQDIGVTDVKREVIDRDLDDLQKMGVNLIRIHVLMSDIALPERF